MRKVLVSLLAVFTTLSMMGADGYTGATASSKTSTKTTTTKKTTTAKKTTAKSGNRDGYNIQISVSKMQNDTVFLAYYMNGKTYSCDTTVLNAKGMGAFSKPEKLDEGLYIVYFNANKYFDLLIGKDQNIKLTVDTAKINEYKVEGASESVDFQGYFSFLGDMNKQRRELTNKYHKMKIDSAEFYGTIDKMTDEVQAHQKSVLDAHQNDFLGAYIKGTMPVETPLMENLPDSVRGRARYQYFKHHYFDNINMSDRRFLRTPYYPNMVDEYISHHILQDPDTLVDAAFNMIEKSRGDSLTFQVMTSKMINYGISSKMMGMDKMWYMIAEKYYFSGLATWADTAWVNTLRKEAKKIRYCMVGMPARDLLVRDSTDAFSKLSKQTADVVLVYFFEPSCGHCRHTTPILHDTVYSKYKNLGFEVFAVYTQTDRQEWMDFVHKHHLEDWVNVWDPYRESWFWEYYDTSATPGLYLLDKDRKIIAKKIDTNTLDMILNEELIVRKGLDQKTVNKLRGISDDSDNNSKSAKASKSGKDKKKK